MTRTIYWSATLACLLGMECGLARAQGGALCDKIAALTSDPTVAMAHWGVSVTTLDGTVLCGINEAQLFRPASNNKLFTTAAALALLGPERRFTTSVVSASNATDGLLVGDLRLVGGGDPDFGSLDIPFVPPAQRPKTPVPEPPTMADIEELADQVVAKGVKSIQGNIVGVDSQFAWEPYPVGWEVDDLDADYGAPVSALTIHDNTQEIDLTPGAANYAPVGVSTLPDVPYYTLQSAGFVTSPTMPPPAKANLTVNHSLASKTIGFYGWIPRNAPPVKLRTAIVDPAEYAALALKQALERRGVTVGGTAVASHANPVASLSGAARTARDAAIDGTVRNVLTPGHGSAQPACEGRLFPAGVALAKHSSPKLADDVLYTLKESQNLHAEILLEQLGSTFTCDNTRASSLSVLRSYLKQIGIAPADFVLYDGSGLSGHDLVAPRALTQILAYAAKQPWSEIYKDALPVGGVDGTLANRFTAPGSKLTGKVYAKTGTLGESRALSGYIDAVGGETLVFSVMVDNHPPGGTADRVTMDKIVEAIAATP
jgi:D-alanyl-D-alanine carboxypeptidase/D-alanyl-D-alanine-endopeptidase (penicillin-binding protein 4)